MSVSVLLSYISLYNKVKIALIIFVISLTIFMPVCAEGSANLFKKIFGEIFEYAYNPLLLLNMCFLYEFICVSK
jgi:hypothetical protein